MPSTNSDDTNGFNISYPSKEKSHSKIMESTSKYMRSQPISNFIKGNAEDSYNFKHKQKLVSKYLRITQDPNLKKKQTNVLQMNKFRDFSVNNHIKPVQVEEARSSRHDAYNKKRWQQDQDQKNRTFLNNKRSQSLETHATNAPELQASESIMDTQVLEHTNLLRTPVPRYANKQLEYRSSPTKCRKKNDLMSTEHMKNSVHTDNRKYYEQQHRVFYS